MKLQLKIKLTVLAFAAGLLSTPSYASAFVETHIDNTVAPCMSVSATLAETDAVKLMQNAEALLVPCYEAMLELDKFEKANPNITPSERNYMFFRGGYVIWLVAAAEGVKNQSAVNVQICNQVRIADALWSMVSVPTGHQVEQEINNYYLRRILVPACDEAFPQQN